MSFRDSDSLLASARRDKLDKDVQDFLSNGGAVQQIETGVGEGTITKSMRDAYLKGSKRGAKINAAQRKSHNKFFMLNKNHTPDSRKDEKK